MAALNAKGFIAEACNINQQALMPEDAAPGVSACSVSFSRQSGFLLSSGDRPALCGSLPPHGILYAQAHYDGRMDAFEQ